MGARAETGSRLDGGVNRRIFNAAAAVTIAGILVKLVATFKEVTVAGVYGRSDAMDAFLAAALIPGLLINLISESMNQALVPTLIRVRELEGHDRAQQLLSSAMLWTTLLLAAAAGVMGLFARAFFPLIASHFPAAKLELSIHLFYALLPVVLLTGIAANCTAVLNTFDQFRAACAGAGGYTLGHSFLRITARRTHGYLGDGVRYIGGCAHPRSMGGMDDGRARVSVSSPLVRDERGCPRGGAPVRPHAAEQRGGLGRICWSISRWPPCSLRAAFRRLSMPTGSSA